MKIQKYILLFVFALSVQILPRQTDTGNTNEQNNKIKVYFINGYGAIYQLNNSHNTFYRIHVDIQADINDSNISKINYARARRDKNISVMLAPEFGCYLINKEYFKFYIGGGPMFSYGYQYLNNEFSDSWQVETSGSYYYMHKTTKNSYSVGIIGFIGIESRIYDNFSIFAEIDTRAVRTWSKGQISNIESFRSALFGSALYNSSGDIDGKEWNFNLSTVRLGFSFLL